MSGPALGGAVQSTDTLIVPVLATVGGSGLPGGSSTSVTFTVTSMVAVKPLPSSAFTVTA